MGRAGETDGVRTVNDKRDGPLLKWYRHVPSERVKEIQKQHSNVGVSGRD